MRLAIIRKRYTPYGGAERFIQELAKSLASQGVQVSIIAASWSGSAVEGLTWIRAEAEGLTRSGRDRSFERSVQQILTKNRFDLVQSHERFVGADICRLGDGLHKAWLTRYLASLPVWRRLPRMLDPFHRRILSLESQMTRSPDTQFVVNSELVRSELMEHYGVRKSKISLIHNGIDTEFFCPPTVEQKDSCREALGIAPGEKLICAVGSGFLRKGYFSLIQGVALLSDMQLIIAGSDQSQDRLRDDIKALGLTKRVRLLGATTDVRSVYWASDVFCLPSLYDPSSNAVLEALACGLPVVTTAGVGTSSEIRTAGAGVICTREPSSISESINLALLRQESLSKKARELASKFRQDERLQEWQQLYKSVLDRRVSE